MGFPGGSVIKNQLANAGDPGDAGSIPGSGRSPGGGNDNPLQYSCLENTMDRETWKTTAQRVTKSRTRLKRLSMHALFSSQESSDDTDMEKTAIIVLGRKIKYCSLSFSKGIIKMTLSPTFYL